MQALTSYQHAHDAADAADAAYEAVVSTEVTILQDKDRLVELVAETLGQYERWQLVQMLAESMAVRYAADTPAGAEWATQDRENIDRNDTIVIREAIEAEVRRLQQ